MATLVVDTGQDIVGIFSVQSRRFAFYRGQSIARAIRRLQSAHEVITYNGKNYDLEELASLCSVVCFTAALSIMDTKPPVVPVNPATTAMAAGP